MSINFIRSQIRKLGLDLHRYHPETEPLSHLKNLSIKTILDIGANVGQFAEEVRGVLPDAKIISFEPVKDCYNKLTSSFSSDKNFKAYNIAIGSENSSIDMNKSSYTPSSSLLPMNNIHKELFPHTKDQTHEKVQVKRLDDILKVQDLEKDILIKIDVQGYEDKVIDGGTNIFQAAKIALIETSFFTFYDGQPLFDDIYKKMIALGFSYQSSSHQKKNKDNGEILMEDSIFIRK